MDTTSPEAKEARCYHYVVLQQGSLPLAPDHSIDRTVEHRCTSVLIWPEEEQPSHENTVLTDPCFTTKGLRSAEDKLTRLGLTFRDIGYLFVTHGHRDHLSNVLFHKKPDLFHAGGTGSLSELKTSLCIGHSPDLHCLMFHSLSQEEIWIVGDAILNLNWLKAWRYYWPNIYNRQEIVQTWESVAKILSHADVIIPGHGKAFQVTASLVKELLSTFPAAQHASECQNVKPFLSERLTQLKEKYL